MEKPGHACHQPLSAILVLRKNLLYQQEGQRLVGNTDGKGNREITGEQNRSRFQVGPETKGRGKGISMAELLDPRRGGPYVLCISAVL